MTAEDLISSIEQIHWLPGADRILHKDWEKIEHGFKGRAASAPELPTNLKRCRQIHGIKIVNDSSFDSTSPPDADGLYKLASSANEESPKSMQAVGVQTADCLPILIANKSGTFKAAVHAGWRGLTAGILVEAVALYRRMGAPSDLLFGIGPAISAGKFEVGPEVLTALKRTSMGLTPVQLALSISKGTLDRWHVDLTSAAALQLTNLEIPPSQIYAMRSCTFSEPERWYSYRREGKGCGMNISWIM